jgi:hypothetical protein
MTWMRAIQRYPALRNGRVCEDCDTIAPRVSPSGLRSINVWCWKAVQSWTLVVLALVSFVLIIPICNLFYVSIHRFSEPLNSTPIVMFVGSVFHPVGLFCSFSYHWTGIKFDIDQSPVSAACFKLGVKSLSAVTSHRAGCMF